MFCNILNMASGCILTIDTDGKELGGDKSPMPYLKVEL